MGAINGCGLRRIDAVGSLCVRPAETQKGIAAAADDNAAANAYDDYGSYDGSDDGLGDENFNIFFSGFQHFPAII